MSKGCGHEYFVSKLNGWRVIQVDEFTEEKIDDVIMISGDPDNISVHCVSNPSHTYPAAQHNSDEGCLEFPGTIATIVCAPGSGTVKDRIAYSGGLFPGSWTAEDNGGGAGGGEG